MLLQDNGGLSSAGDVGLTCWSLSWWVGSVHRQAELRVCDFLLKLPFMNGRPFVPFMNFLNRSFIRTM